MAATTRVRDFLWRVCSALNDYNPQFTTWGEIELVMALNDGQIAICKYIPFACTRTDALLMQPGCMQSIRSIPTTSILTQEGLPAPTAPIAGRQLSRIDCNMGAAGTAPGRIVRVTDRDDLDTIDPDWQTRTGATVKAYCYDPETPTLFYITPGATATPQVWLRASYAALPPTLTGGAPGSEKFIFATGTDNTLLAIDDTNVDDLMNYVLARANMKDDANSKPQFVQIQTNSFITSINAQATALTGVNPNLKRLPMMTDSIGSAS